MSTYVLVHGSWSGAWFWDKVIPLLKEHGHTAIAPDLPGHGRDTTPLAEITLQSYVDRVCQVLDALAEPVLLVGHSHGGIVITQTAEERPEKIRTLVYLCAYLPRNGESLLDWGQRDPDMANNVISHLILNPEDGYAEVREDAIKDAFYGDCSDADVARARGLMVPREPLSSPGTPVQTTAAKFGRLPRVYITGRQDRAISPALQQLMYTASPCQQVITMDTSHSPAISAPDELVRHLLALGGA